jgi:hypothetical protein
VGGESRRESKTIVRRANNWQEVTVYLAWARESDPFDHKGVYFIGLNNSAQFEGMGALGDEQLAWIKSDVAKRGADLLAEILVARVSNSSVKQL